MDNVVKRRSYKRLYEGYVYFSIANILIDENISART
jgi:ABC-type long-subunit fatty acid transport system fused permease/ATPase subunit